MHCSNYNSLRISAGNHLISKLVVGMVAAFAFYSFTSGAYTYLHISTYTYICMRAIVSFSSHCLALVCFAAPPPITIAAHAQYYQQQRATNNSHADKCIINAALSAHRATVSARCFTNFFSAAIHWRCGGVRRTRRRQYLSFAH